MDSLVVDDPHPLTGTFTVTNAQQEFGNFATARSFWLRYTNQFDKGRDQCIRSWVRAKASGPVLEEAQFYQLDLLSCAPRNQGAQSDLLLFDRIKP